MKGLFMKQYQNRSEVEEKYKWDLTEYFASDKEFYQAYEEVQKDLTILETYRGCTKDANKLYEYLTTDIKIETMIEQMDGYTYLKNDEELGKSENIEKIAKANELVTKINNITSFFEPELLKLSKEEFYDLFKKNSKLEEYKVYLEHIYRNKEHTLSENEEKIVNSLVMATNNFSDMSSNLINMEHNYGKVTLSTGEKVVLSTTNSRFLQSNDSRKVRKEAHTKLNKKALEYATSSADFLNSYVNLNDALANIYHFKDSFDASLFERNLTENIFNVLSDTVRANVKTLQRYYEVRRNILGLDTLYSYDLGAKLSHSKKEYSIEEGIEIVRQALAPLGEDYVNRYNKIIENRCIDFCGYKGKCSGGYCLSTSNQNSRILMSYNYNLESISTIAHESGHHVHHQLLQEHNPAQYRNVSTILAEVASLTNEFLLSHYIFEHAKDKEEKVLALENSLSVIASNLFGAVREGDMERDMHERVHQKEAITQEYMNDLTKKSLQYYYGDKVKLTPYAKASWIFRSHYYSSFYLYDYAFCVSIAASLASKILANDKETLNNYLKFLTIGSDVWPTDALKTLGVSLEDKTVYQNAIDYFDQLVSELESLY